MNFRHVCAKLTGNPDTSAWAQVYEFVPDDSERVDSRGQIHAVLATKGNLGENAHVVRRGKAILLKLNEEYYASSEASAFQALKNAIHQVVQQFAIDGVEVEIAAAASLKDVVYLAAAGGGQISLFRQGSLASILKSGTGVAAASGKLVDGDLLVLSTGEFFADVSDADVGTALKSLDPASAVETLAPSLHAADVQGNKGLVIIKFEEAPESTPLEVPAEKEDLEKTLEEIIAEDKKSLEPHVHSESDVPVVAKTDLFGKIKGLRGKLFSKGRDSVAPKQPAGLSARGLYIKQREVEVEEVQKRKTAVSVGALLLVLLVVSIGFGVYQRGVKNGRVDLDAKLTEAKHNLEEATALFALNPGRARELFSQSQKLVDELAVDFPKESEVEELKKQLDKGRQTVLGEFDTGLEEYLDLTLIEGFEAERLAATGDAMYIFDKGRKRIAEVVIDSKSTEVVVGPAQINRIDAMSAYSGRVFIADGDGVFEVGGGREKVLDKEWNGDILLYAYAGNLYLLEKETSTIWRYPANSSGGFGSRGSWLAPGISIDLSNIASWSIDGTVWVLTRSGKVERYSFGSPQDLNEIKVVPALASPTAIYTNEELNSIYILDPSTERVVVLDKEGNYKAQYKSSVLKDALGIAASEKEEKIIVLTKDKLVSIPLNN